MPNSTVESPNKESDLYVELNNKLVDAMEKYENGEITKEEYEEICTSVVIWNTDRGGYVITNRKSNVNQNIVA